MKIHSKTTNYFRREKAILKICGFPLEKNKSTQYKMFVVYCLLLIPYPFLSLGNPSSYQFVAITRILQYSLVTILGICIAFVMSKKGLKLRHLLDTLEREPFLTYSKLIGREGHKWIAECLRFNYIQATVFCTICVFVISLPIVFTLIKRILYDDYRHWEFSFGAFTTLNVRGSPTFEILWVYQNIAVCSAAALATTFILIFSFVMALVAVHFRILQKYLRRIVHYSYKKMLKYENQVWKTCDQYDPSIIPWKYLQKSLKNAVQYHLEIINVVKEAEGIFGFLLGTVHGIVFIILCFSVYQTSLVQIKSFEVLERLFEMLAALMVSFLICYWGERINHESLLVAKAAYNADFVGADSRFQKGLLIIMMNSQKGVQIRAGKIIENSMQTFAGILRTTYSTFMIIRNLVNDE